MRPNRIHAANLKTSKRLQRVLKTMKACGRHGATTRDIMYMANVCAVNSCIAELRVAGYPITCKREADVFRYKLEGVK